MNRIIVTGGNGFIGRYLVRKLLSLNSHEIVVVSNTPNDKLLSVRKEPEEKLLTSYSADIRDRSAISDIFSEVKADACVHLAAKVSVIESIKNPDETMESNSKGTINVLEACHKSQTKNFVFASSAAVYGDPAILPIPENLALHPISPYGTSKMLAERHIKSYVENKKIQNAIALRIFNVYGQSPPGKSDIITRFSERLSRGLPPIIHGDGQQTRDFISVEDVVQGIILSLRAMEKIQNDSDGSISNSNKIPKISSVLNLGTGIPTSIDELARKMIKICGLDLEPAYVYENEDNIGVIKQSYADMKKLKEVLNFVPKKNIDIGLREILEPMLLRK